MNKARDISSNCEKAKKKKKDSTVKEIIFRIVMRHMLKD